jgi:hypothetical protein
MSTTVATTTAAAAPDPILIASWRSRGGKYWIDVYDLQDGSYRLRSDGCGGIDYDRAAILATAERQAGYCPSKLARVL